MNGMTCYLLDCGRLMKFRNCFGLILIADQPAGALSRPYHWVVTDVLRFCDVAEGLRRGRLKFYSAWPRAVPGLGRGPAFEFR